MNLSENRENGNQPIEYYTESQLQYLGLFFFYSSICDMPTIYYVQV